MKILLVDGTNLVMRYASAMVPNLDEAVPDDVARVCRGVEKAVRECSGTFAECSHAIVALDSTDSWRKREYPEYKANRFGTTGVWSNRLAIHCGARGLYTLRSPGFEADDVIATLVARAGRAGYPSAVLSGDSDLLALASLYCDVWQFGRANEPRFVRRSMEWIAEKYEIDSSVHLTGFKALVGEPGDNLPGLPGIGPVKARKLLRQHGSVEALLSSGALTAEQTEQLTLMLHLVRLREDVPLDPVQPWRCKLTPPMEATT